MDKTKIQKIISNIQEKANEKFNKNLWDEIQPDAVILRVLDTGIRKLSLPKWKRDYYKVMRKEWDKKKTVLNKEVAAAKDEYVEEQINKEIKLGRIPTREEMQKHVQDISHLKTNAKDKVRV